MYVKSHSDDNRSYHISSKIFDAIKFKAKFTINDAIKDLKYAFDKKLILNSFEDENYFNIKMNKIDLF